MQESDHLGLIKLPADIYILDILFYLAKNRLIDLIKYYVFIF